MPQQETDPVGNSRREFISKTSVAAGAFLMSGGIGLSRFAQAETLGASSGIPAVAYGAPSVGATLVAFDLRRRDLRPNDVHVAIQYSGVCHTDWHWIKGEWAGGEYPLVPGHEIAGVVVAVGSQVAKYKVGDHVGVGNFVDSCRHCAPCSIGREIYCENGGPTWTYGGHERVNGSLKPNGPRTFGGFDGHHRR